MIQAWTMHTTKQLIIPDRHIVKDYSVLTGYDPKTGEKDEGAAALDLMKYWRNNGVGGHKIIAFASVDHTDKTLIAQTLYLFGGLFGGLQLPRSIIGQKVWSLLPTGTKGDGKVGSYGGHAVTVLDYDKEGLTCISWGRKQKMTWDFWNAYADEAYVVLSHHFLKHNKTPAGFSLSSLEKDLMSVTGQKVKLSKQLSAAEKKQGAKAKKKRK